MQVPFELISQIDYSRIPIQHINNNSGYRATSSVQRYNYNNQRCNSNMSHNRIQSRGRSYSSGSSIRRDKHYYLPDEMRFSFQAPHCSHVVKGAGPWGPTDWYDVNGRLPVTFGYTADDWKLFWHIYSNIHINRLNLSQYNCYVAMMAERRRWRNANADQLRR